MPTYLITFIALIFKVLHTTKIYVVDCIYCIYVATKTVARKSPNVPYDWTILNICL